MFRLDSEEVLQPWQPQSPASAPATGSSSALQAHRANALLHFTSLWRCSFGRQPPTVAVDRQRGFELPLRGWWSPESSDMPSVSAGNVAVWAAIRCAAWGNQSWCNGDFREWCCCHVLGESWWERWILWSGASPSTAGRWGEVEDFTGMGF